MIFFLCLFGIKLQRKVLEMLVQKLSIEMHEKNLLRKKWHLIFFIALSFDFHLIFLISSRIHFRFMCNWWMKKQLLGWWLSFCCVYYLVWQNWLLRWNLYERCLLNLFLDDLMRLVVLKLKDWKDFDTTKRFIVFLTKLVLLRFD